MDKTAFWSVYRQRVWRGKHFHQERFFLFSNVLKKRLYSQRVFKINQKLVVEFSNKDKARDPVFLPPLFNRSPAL